MQPTVCLLSLTGALACHAGAGSEPNAGPPVVRHVRVYAEPGRFGGWPANHGIWSWGNEILVGFSAGYFKDNGPDRHAIDHDRPEEHLLARSRDGGETWTVEDPAAAGALVPAGKMLHGIPPPGRRERPWRDCPGGIDFTHPGFALTARMTDTNAGPSRFYYSLDRGKTWQGPFRLPLFGQKGIAARTDYVVNGPHDCFLFLTAAKEDGREGRPLCVRTRDGGRSWQLVSFIGDEPPGYAIMPATVRLGPRELLTAIRRREATRSWIETYRSSDDGRTWQPDTVPAPDLGEGNPASLIRLADGRLCLTHGVRAAPFGIRARLSADGGRTWGREVVLRADGGGRDLGYPRSVQRPDGKVVTIYYFHDTPRGDRSIAATIWDPGRGRAAAPLDSRDIVVEHDIRYRDGPSKQWRLDLAMPKDRGGKPRPGIAVIHGGGWVEGDKASFASRRHGVPGNIEDFAALGFVAATINYRLSGEAPFPAALEDCKCAVRWLRAHAREYNLDPGHVGAYGNSAGGHLALLLAMAGKEAGLEGDGPHAEQSSLVQAAVSDSGPIDLLFQYRHPTLRRVVRRFLGGPPEGPRAHLYRKASPIHQVTPRTAPLLLIYGGADDQVPIETADQFVAALSRAGVKDVTYLRLAYVEHCPHSLVRVPALQQVVNEFFLRTLMHPETAQQIRRRER